MHVTALPARQVDACVVVAVSGGLFDVAGDDVDLAGSFGELLDGGGTLGGDVGDLVAEHVPGQRQLGEDDDLATRLAGRLDRLQVDVEVGGHVPQPGLDLGDDDTDVVHVTLRNQPTEVRNLTGLVGNRPRLSRVGTMPKRH